MPVIWEWAAKVHDRAHATATQPRNKVGRIDMVSG